MFRDIYENLFVKKFCISKTADVDLFLHFPFHTILLRVEYLLSNKFYYELGTFQYPRTVEIENLSKYLKRVWHLKNDQKSPLVKINQRVSGVVINQYDLTLKYHCYSWVLFFLFLNHK